MTYEIKRADEVPNLSRKARTSEYPFYAMREGWPIARHAPETPPALDRDQSAEIDRLIARQHAARANDWQEPQPPLIGVTGIQLAAFVALLMGTAFGLGALLTVLAPMVARLMGMGA